MATIDPCDFGTPEPCHRNAAFTFTRYPCDIDTPRPAVDTLGLPVIVDLQTPVKAEVVNRHRESILAIEGELGIEPSGTYNTVRDRLDALQALLCGIWSSVDEGAVRVLYNSLSVTNNVPVKEINFYGNGVSVTEDPSFATNGRVNVNIPCCGGSHGGGVDGYHPVQESLTITTNGQTAFTLSLTPYNNLVLLFIDRIQQDFSDYVVSGTSLTWNGAVPLVTSDRVEVFYEIGSSGILENAYEPVTHALGVDIVGRTVFLLPTIPNDNLVVLFIGGLKMPISDYTVSGNYLTWTGSQILLPSDVVEAFYTQSEVEVGSWRPIAEELTVTTPGQLIFTLSTEAWDDFALLFINGIKQTEYIVNGTDVVWEGSVILVPDDIVEVLYFVHTADSSVDVKKIIGLTTADSYADLRNILAIGTPVKAIYVLGRNSSGDGGEGLANIVPIGSYVDNDGTVFTGGTQAATRPVGVVKATEFGMKINNPAEAASNTTAIMAAATMAITTGSGVLELPPGIVYHTPFELGTEFAGLKMYGYGIMAQGAVGSGTILRCVPNGMSYWDYQIQITAPNLEIKDIWFDGDGYVSDVLRLDYFACNDRFERCAFSGAMPTTGSLNKVIGTTAVSGTVFENCLLIQNRARAIGYAGWCLNIDGNSNCLIRYRDCSFSHANVLWRFRHGSADILGKSYFYDWTTYCLEVYDLCNSCEINGYNDGYSAPFFSQILNVDGYSSATITLRNLQLSGVADMYLNGQQPVLLQNVITDGYIYLQPDYDFGPYRATAINVIFQENGNWAGWGYPSMVDEYGTIYESVPKNTRNIFGAQSYAYCNTGKNCDTRVDGDGYLLYSPTNYDSNGITLYLSTQKPTTRRVVADEHHILELTQNRQYEVSVLGATHGTSMKVSRYGASDGYVATIMVGDTGKTPVKISANGPIVWAELRFDEVSSSWYVFRTGNVYDLDGYATIVNLQGEVSRAEDVESEIKQALDGYVSSLDGYINPYVNQLLFVDGYYGTIGGDGSLGRPFKTISGALAYAESHVLQYPTPEIRIAPGTYLELIIIPEATFYKVKFSGWNGFVGDGMFATPSVNDTIICSTTGDPNYDFPIVIEGTDTSATPVEFYGLTISGPILTGEFSPRPATCINVLFTNCTLTGIPIDGYHVEIEIFNSIVTGTSAFTGTVGLDIVSDGFSWTSIVNSQTTISPSNYTRRFIGAAVDYINSTLSMQGLAIGSSTSLALSYPGIRAGDWCICSADPRDLIDCTVSFIGASTDYVSFRLRNDSRVSTNFSIPCKIACFHGDIAEVIVPA